MKLNGYFGLICFYSHCIGESDAVATVSLVTQISTNVPILVNLTACACWWSMSGYAQTAWLYCSSSDLGPYCHIFVLWVPLAPCFWGVLHPADDVALFEFMYVIGNVEVASPRSICPYWPPGGTEANILKPSTRGSSQANVPTSNAWWRSHANEPKTATRGTPRPICANQPTGELHEPICQHWLPICLNQLPGGAPGPTYPNQPPGGAPGANLPK